MTLVTLIFARVLHFFDVVYCTLKTINNLWRENKGNHNREGDWACDLAFNFNFKFLQELLMVSEGVSSNF